MTLFMRVLSTGVSLEEAAEIIYRVEEIDWAKVTRYNNNPVVELQPDVGISNAKATAAVRAAMKPSQITIWKRPDPPRHTGRARN